MTIEQFRDKYGNTDNSRTFVVYDGHDELFPGEQYLVFFKNETYTFWKPPYQFKGKRLREIQYFLSADEDATPFVFGQEDVKYMCSLSLYYCEQIGYLRSIWGPDRPGTFEDA